MVELKVSQDGLPHWLINPVVISTDLSDSAHRNAVDAPHVHLSESTLKNCEEVGVTELFPVQEAVIKTILQDLPAECFESSRSPWEFCHLQSIPSQRPRDILVSAPTGSGKTYAYVIPIVESLKSRCTIKLRALVVVPTIDLVTQVKAVFEQFVKGTDLRVIALSGGGRVRDEKHTQKQKFSKEQERLANPVNFGASGGFLSCFFKQEEHDYYECSCDILVTTPGRLVDHLAFTKGFTLEHLEWLIVDEADRLFNQSYHEWLPKVIGASVRVPDSAFFSLRDLSAFKPEERQNAWCFSDEEFNPEQDAPEGQVCGSFGPPVHMRKMLFSATLTRNPGKLQALSLYNPVLISAKIESESSAKYSLPSTLNQYYWVCHQVTDKPALLLFLMLEYAISSAICFTSSIENAERLCTLLEESLQVLGRRETKIACYSAALTVSERASIVKRFKRGEISLLICTDALSRGLDVSQTEDDYPQLTVINYDVPGYAKTYVHRAGRTARAGKEGSVYSLMAKHECRHWKQMMRDHGLWLNMKRLSKQELSKDFFNQVSQAVEDAIENFQIAGHKRKADQVDQ